MKIGFIGMGNMAKAIASGFIASKKMPVSLALFRAKVFCLWRILAMFL